MKKPIQPLKVTGPKAPEWARQLFEDELNRFVRRRYPNLARDLNRALMLEVAYGIPAELSLEYSHFPQDQLEIGGEIRAQFEENYLKRERALRDPKDTVKIFRTKAPKAGPFLWLTHAGELINPKDMATPHLYYALRMIFNHTVPKEFQTPASIHPVKRYQDVPHWSDEYKEAAIKALTAELETRNPKGLDDPSMRDGLRWMSMAATALRYAKEGK